MGSAPAGWRPPEDSPISKQQRRILVLRAQGLTYGQIGARLTLAPGTVKSHCYRMAKQLGTSLKELVAFARRHAELPPEADR